MPLRVARAVLALPVRLIDRCRIDARASGARPLVMRVDIVDVHEETRIRDVRGERGIEPVLGGHAVEPDVGVATRTSPWTA